MRGGSERLEMKSSSSWKWSGGEVVLTLALNDRLIFVSLLSLSSSFFCTISFLQRYNFQIYFSFIKIIVFLCNHEKRRWHYLPIMMKENRCFAKREKYKNLMQYEKWSGVFNFCGLIFNEYKKIIVKCAYNMQGNS